MHHPFKSMDFMDCIITILLNNHKYDATKSDSLKGGRIRAHYSKVTSQEGGVKDNISAFKLRDE